MEFEWDQSKAEANERKHGIPFSEAMTAYGDPLSVTGDDPGNAKDKDRFLTMGTTIEGRPGASD